MSKKTQSLFGTSGIRGEVDKLFTKQFCFDIGRTFVKFLNKHKQTGPIAIGIDSRTSSPRIAQDLAASLNYEGRETTYLGAVPVSATHYSILSTPAIASIMVTGSHIDIKSNGIKFFALKEEIDKNHEKEISTIYAQIKNQVKPKAIKANFSYDSSGFDNYLEMLIGLADSPLPKLKIAFDPGNGAQTNTIKTLLLELGQEVFAINDDIQKELISRDTEKDGSFSDLQALVLKKKADLGIGFDTDGDRIVFVDRQGKFISGDYSGTILAKWNKSNTIVTPINVSGVIDSIGKEIIRTKVGSPFVVAQMKKSGTNFGFEGNGGCIHREIMMSRDGGATLVKMLNILKWSQKRLDQLVSQLPQYFIRRDKFDCPRNKNKLILSQAKNFAQTESINDLDGVKLILDKDNWVLFRPSSNAPEFRVFVESNTQAKADKLLSDALKFAQKQIKK